MSARESYGLVGGGDDGQSSQVSMQNMRVAYGGDGTAVYKPTLPPPTSPASTAPMYRAAGGDGALVVAAQPGLNANSVEPAAKRRRGRPRKYASDSSIAPGLTSPPTSAAELGASPSSTGKKSRGRPPGSGRKQQTAALGSTGAGFTPHIITVKAGEDVLAKLMSFSQNNTRAVCVLSANGAISNVTLRQASMSGGSVTYEGRFEILSLSGSFLLSDSVGQRSRTGGLSVSLAGPDGRVLGGGVAGLLTAAAPVQVIVGSFMTGSHKRSKSGAAEGLIAASKLVSVAGAVGSSPSHGTLSESSGGAGSPLNHSTGACNNNNPPGMANIPWR